MTPELVREMAEGRATLGGCCTSGDDPAWACVDCGDRAWRKEPGR